MILSLTINLTEQICPCPSKLDSISVNFNCSIGTPEGIVLELKCNECGRGVVAPITALKSNLVIVKK